MIQALIAAEDAVLAPHPKSKSHRPRDRTLGSSQHSHANSAGPANKPQRDFPNCRPGRFPSSLRASPLRRTTRTASCRLMPCFIFSAAAISEIGAQFLISIPGHCSFGNGNGAQLQYF